MQYSELIREAAGTTDKGFPDKMSHSVSVPSSDPEASLKPSEEKAKEETFLDGLSCNSSLSFPESISQKEYGHRSPLYPSTVS